MLRAKKNAKLKKNQSDSAEKQASSADEAEPERSELRNCNQVTHIKPLSTLNPAFFSALANVSDQAFLW